MINALIFTLITFIPFAYTKQINGNYFNAKMFLVYILGSFCLTQVVLLSDSLRKIKFSKPLWTALLFLLIYQIFGQVFNHPLTVLYSFKAISLCAMTYYFYNLKFSPTENLQKQFSMWLTLIITGLLGMPLYEVYGSRLVQNTVDH